MPSERTETGQRRRLNPFQVILASVVFMLSLGLSPSLSVAAPGYGGVQTSISGTNRSSFSVRYDQLGLAIGDVLVVALTTDYSSAGSIIVQGSGHPGGVTVYNAGDTSSGQPRLRVDVLVYDGTWPSTLDYRFSVSDRETWIAYASKWSGVDPVNPVAASAGRYEGVTANPTSPALIAPESGLTAVAVYGAREDDFDSNGTPAGYTSIGIGASNIGSTGSSSGMAYRSGISSGTVPAAMWTQAAATQAHAAHLLLRGADNGTAILQDFNEALYATPTVSSTSSARRQYHANDGIGTVASNGWIGTEDPSTENAWIRLTFDSPKTIYRVVLSDIMGPTAQLEAGSIEFSDGRSVVISSPLPDDGTPQEFVFTPEQTDWVQINLTRATGNYGLAEVAAYSALDPNQTKQNEDLFNDGNDNGWTPRADGAGCEKGSFDWGIDIDTGVLPQGYQQGGDCRGFTQDEGVEIGSYSLGFTTSTAGMDLRLRLLAGDTGARWTNGAIGVLFGYVDDDNYYRLDISGREGHRKLWKKVGGAFTELNSSPQSYTLGEWFNLRIVHQNGAILVYMDGEKVLAVEDTTFSGGRIALFCARNESCTFDNVVVLSPPGTAMVGANITDEDVASIPDSKGHKSGEYFVDTDGTLNVAAVVTGSTGFDSVEFVIDEGLPGEMSMTDFTVPYERTFGSIPAGEHAIRTYLIDAAGQRLPDSAAMDELPLVGVNGIHLIGLGDSITDGSQDDFAGDDISSDGRNTGGGYQSVLNDLLAADNLKPVTVLNEGNPGETSAEGADRVAAVIARAPEAQGYLVLYGANDARSSLILPSGLGLDPSDPGYAGSFKNNLERIMSAILGAGKRVFPGKTLPKLPDDARNVAIQEFNQVVDELVAEKGIAGYTAPDFFAYFTNNPSEMNSDGIHPAGSGYQSMARGWCEALSGQLGLVCTVSLF